jgi:hypothetical protein
MVTVAPGFNDTPEAGLNVIVMVLLPEQPAKTSAQTRIPTASNERTLNCLKVSPQKVLTTSSRKSNPLERE